MAKLLRSLEGLLQARGEDSLEVGALLFARDDGHLDTRKASFLEPLVQLHFAESEPEIGVEFARLFEMWLSRSSMTRRPPFFKIRKRGGNGALGAARMVQRLTEEARGRPTLLNRRVLDVAQAVFEVVETVALREFRSELDHLLRVVDRDDFSRVFASNLRKGPLTRPEVRNRDRPDQRDQRVRKPLPCATGAMAATEPARQLVEIFAPLVMPLLQDDLKRGPIHWGLRHFSRGRTRNSLTLDRCGPCF